MAVQRIRYMKTSSPNVFKSRNLYSTKYKTYYYVIKDQSQEVFTFRIVNVKQKRTVFSYDESRITNRAVLHRTIREKLEDFGIDLDTEIRPHQKAPSMDDRLRGGLKSKSAGVKRKKDSVTEE